jgi:protein TonB
VEVRFSITVEGAVENLSIASASPPDVFDRAAMEAVSRWRYDPRVVDDKPVESPAQVRLDFKLDPNAK